MPIACPACGFFTIDDVSYGSYDICEICGWEDDPLQLGNPASGGGANGESLIACQTAALAELPLEIMVLGVVERDPQWRPLRAKEVAAAELAKTVNHWGKPSVVDPANVYWRSSEDVH